MKKGTPEYKLMVEDLQRCLKKYNIFTHGLIPMGIFWVVWRIGYKIRKGV